MGRNFSGGSFERVLRGSQAKRGLWKLGVECDAAYKVTMSPFAIPDGVLALQVAVALSHSRLQIRTHIPFVFEKDSPVLALNTLASTSRSRLTIFLDLMCC